MKSGKAADGDTIRTILGDITIATDEHQRCVNCVRYRPSRHEPGTGFCTRTLFDAAGQFLGRANEPVREDYFCPQFLSRLGQQQQ
ncbi:MAG: hypothetical protein AAB229_00125 [Candidatus Hydrogenedentota bacterium]